VDDKSALFDVANTPGSDSLFREGAETCCGETAGGISDEIFHLCDAHERLTTLTLDCDVCINCRCPFSCVECVHSSTPVSCVYCSDCQDSDCEEDVSDLSDAELEESETNRKNNEIKSDFINIAVSNSIPHGTIQELLSFFRKHSFIKFLRSPKTLLKRQLLLK
jgi:hypothetical protein